MAEPGVGQEKYKMKLETIIVPKVIKHLKMMDTWQITFRLKEVLTVKYKTIWAQICNDNSILCYIK